jgi:diguanylate cyclase (GGDEF)-like protein
MSHFKNSFKYPSAGALSSLLRLPCELEPDQCDQRAQEVLDYLIYDHLTGLPNRKTFIHFLEERFTVARNTADYNFAVIVFDLDRFKFINNSLGYAAGDQLLTEISQRMTTCIRDGDIIARLGSDEFGILLHEVSDLDDAIAVADRLTHLLEEPLTLQNTHTVFTSISLGIAPGSAHYQFSEEILRDADTAMHHTKQDNKIHYQIFDQQMHLKALRTLQIETDLRIAVRNQELSLNYQPIISLRDAKIIGFEALARWHHKEWGWVSPTEFIPVAEACGLIIPLGYWVIEEACRQLSKLQAEFPDCRDLVASINISGKQICDPQFTNRVKQILKENGIDPKNLKIEVTESSLLGKYELIMSNIRQIKQCGIRIAMDDFGTGYSSLSYLCRFDFDTLKIDRSFVQSASSERIEIIHAIITLANSLGMDVVAEGIETESQLAQLLALDCNYGQGFLFSKPLQFEDLRALLSQGYVLSHHLRNNSKNDRAKLWNWSKSQLVTHIECLQQEVETLSQEKLDLEVLLEATSEHADWLEIELQNKIKNYQKTEAELQQANEILGSLAVIDELTQVANRRRFDTYLENIWENQGVEQATLSLILLDIDFFKQYNDTYGHQSGDSCLYRIAQAIKAAIPTEEALVARYGGEEFAVILPNVDRMTAVFIAKKIKTQIRNLSIPHSQSKVDRFVTISQGIACIVPSPSVTASEMIRLADGALYQAKANGRDCFYLAP